MRAFSVKELPSSVVILNLQHGYVIYEASDRFLNEAGLISDRNRLGTFENTLSFLDLIYKDDVRVFMEYFATDGEEYDPDGIEIRIRDKSRSYVWTDVRAAKLEDSEYADYAMVSLNNIDSKKHLEDDLRVQMARFNLIKDVSNEFIFEYNPKSDTFTIPMEMQLHRGIPVADDYEGVSMIDFREMIGDSSWRHFEDRIVTKFKVEDSGVFEYEMNRSRIGRTPKYKWYRCFYKRLYDVNGELTRVICRNIDIQGDHDKTTDMEQRIRMDSMTGILNKAACEDEIARFIGSHPEGEHALIMIDVDDFKRINDSFGHLYGDTVIKTVATHLMERFRSTDIVGRIGGDEFLVLMKNATAELAASVAGEVCKHIRTTVRTGKGDLVISCSVGISMFPDSGLEYTELFKRAEIAMYLSKKDGKDRVGVYKDGIENMLPAEKPKLSELSEAEFEDAELTQMAFEMLTKSKNIDASINLLLQYVGKKANLGGIAVFRFDNRRPVIARTHKWTKEQGIFLISGRRFLGFDNKPLITDVRREGNIVIDDMRTTDLISRYEADSLLEDNIYSCVYSYYCQSETVQGCLGFQVMSEPRKFSEHEVEYLSDFAKLIGVFIALNDKAHNMEPDEEEEVGEDKLTGLLDDETFTKYVEEYRMLHPDEKRLFVVSGDIDGFAYVNDNFGTSAGNELLREIGRIFKSQVSNVFVCRQFSDFFCAFFAEYEEEEVMSILKKYSDKFIDRTSKYFPNSALRVALGIYKWDEDTTIATAMENASMARKSAKKLGSSVIVEYNNDMREQRKRDRLIASSFYSDLESGNILLYMQPKFNLKTKEIIGAESLARWRDEIGDPLPPVRFIDSLERIGYITDLDFYILEQTLMTMAEWKVKGYKLVPVSVNFSRRHFQMGGIYDRVVDLTDKYGIPHSLIEIELTENLFMESLDFVKREMHLLHVSGFKINIDDFGTGFSSLTMFMNMPADVVKIDKSFLKFDADSFEKSKEFMKTLADMLKISGNRVICEGVETQEHAEFLLKCGFEYGQGFLIDPPIPSILFEQKYMATEPKKK
ncbi:MAG: EAL domain-containing protein [Lachnospiraceae bacterium]|nr:EAL domain-containing protein [Lachnospiraceae bacterium]